MVSGWKTYKNISYFVRAVSNKAMTKNTPWDVSEKSPAKRWRTMAIDVNTVLALADSQSGAWKQANSAVAEGILALLGITWQQSGKDAVAATCGYTYCGYDSACGCDADSKRSRWRHCGDWSERTSHKVGAEDVISSVKKTLRPEKGGGVSYFLNI